LITLIYNLMLTVISIILVDRLIDTSSLVLLVCIIISSVLIISIFHRKLTSYY